MTRNRQFLTAVIMLGASAALFAHRAEAAGAIAVGHCGADGYSFNQHSVGAAEEVAMQECGPGCSVAVHFENACGAYAVDSAKQCGAQGWGWASDRGGAEEIAVRECVNQGGESCAVKRWVCDGG